MKDESDHLNFPKTTMHETVTESLAMRKMCAKFVPKVLTDKQRARRVKMLQEFLDDSNFLENNNSRRYLSMTKREGVKAPNSTPYSSDIAPVDFFLFR